MVAELNRQELNFSPIPNSLPPHNIEAEECILGSILLDPFAIHRVKSRLKPEHFYYSAHAHIYKACLDLTKKGLLCDLITLGNHLRDKGLDKEIGGKSKLHSLLGITVSSVNIDALATLVIQKHARRELIRLGDDVTRFAFSSDIELEDVLQIVRRRTESAINLDAAKTKDELIKDKHDRLIAAMRHLYTTVPSPSERLMRMFYLGKEFDLSIKFLEQLYTKSLVDTCTARLTYAELKELAGTTVREWLQQGLVPIGSSILLAADGGVGKTNFAYTITKKLITGENLGDFHSTGEKRRILICQGDEQPSDTAEKLELLGYDENDIGKYVEYRYGWSFESMSYLIKDINEFKPDLIIFDSLTFGNRFAICTENETEYARPILEINMLLAEHRCSAIFIHHTNQGGGVRGATAIRNAVSEVWMLSADSRQDATPYDRILTIDKSRSRSSKKKYKMYFDPYTLEFNFLGEDYQSDNDAQDKGARDRILRFFHEHRNTKYEAEEIGNQLHISSGHARRTLSALAVDGLLSVERRAKQPNLYFLAYTSPNNGSDPPPFLIRGQTHDQQDDQQDDQHHNLEPASVSAVADHLIIKNDDFQKQKTENLEQNSRSDDQQLPEPLQNKENVADHGSNPTDDQQADFADHDQQPKPPKPLKFNYPSASGTVFCTAESHGENKWLLMWRYPVGKNKQNNREFEGDEEDVRKKFKSFIPKWINSQRYKVTVDGEVINKCKCIALPDDRISRFNYHFQTPDGQDIYVSNPDNFEWQAPGAS